MSAKGALARSSNSRSHRRSAKRYERLSKTKKARSKPTWSNAEPKPFVWTAKAANILEKVVRGRKALESVH